MKRLYTILIVIAASIAGLVHAEVDEAAAIKSLNIGWDNALNKGNTSELVKSYTDNAVVMPPSSEILTNHASIKNYWDGLRKVGVNEYVIRTVDLRIDGDTAYQTALWEATRNAADGNVFQFEGNMSNVLERQKDGSWKIKLQSWN